jgi:DNA-binding CsgD family transcriptional regulator
LRPRRSDGDGANVSATQPPALLTRIETGPNNRSAESKICLTTSCGATVPFQRLAASWDLDRASAAARRYGVPVPSRHRRGPKGYGTDLSPRERAVAELAAAGRTNQQIADELFVSVNTVKKQLAAAMRKLEVASRSALFHRLMK